MEKSKRGYLLAALIGAIAIFGAAFPLFPAFSLTGYKEIEAGKLLRANDTTQGYVAWSQTLYFTGFSKAGTGEILDFSNVKLGVAGYVMPRLGWCSDTAAVNVTVTSVAKWEVKYAATGAGTQRLWCPDKGEPDNIVGGALGGWDAVNQVATITTGGASAVTVTWYPPASTPGTLSNSIREGILIFLGFFGLIMALIAVRKGEVLNAILSVLMMIVIPWLLALLVEGLGF